MSCKGCKKKTVRVKIDANVKAMKKPEKDSLIKDVERLSYLLNVRAVQNHKGEIQGLYKTIFNLNPVNFNVLLMKENLLNFRIRNKM